MRSNLVQIIPKKLYFLSDRTPPRKRPNSYFFCTDKQLIYHPFCSDFGPLNIGMTYKYCKQLKKILKNPRYRTNEIIHYTSLTPQKRANAACLISCFSILVLKKTAQQAWAPFSQQPPFEGFRDAGYSPPTYKCTILHILHGLQKAVRRGWFSLSSFDLASYEYYQRVENGDWNWIIPNKILALACPSSSSRDQEGFKLWTPESYVPLFKKLGVTAVVRLNNVTYDYRRFTNNGIKHYELFFADGSCPSSQLVEEFLKIAEKEQAIAVHCKAGLGRTGTMIGCFAMKHFGFHAQEFIGWARLMRPGSVLGPQQQFLVQTEQKYRPGSPCEPISPAEKKIKVFGDHGQAERLLSAKKQHQSPIRPLRAISITSRQNRAFVSRKRLTPSGCRKKIMENRFKFTDYQRAELENAFKKFQPDSQGKISFESIENLMNSFGEAKHLPIRSNPDLPRTFPNGSNHCDFNDFISILEQNISEPEAFQRALSQSFKMMDLKNTGYVDPEDLMAVSELLGESISSIEQARRITSRAEERSEDGKLTLKSLKAFLYNDIDPSTSPQLFTVTFENLRDFLSVFLKVG